MQVKTERLTIEASGSLTSGAAAQIDHNAATKFVIPMIANASLPTASTVEGMIAYDTTNDKIVVSNGTSWETVTSS